MLAKLAEELPRGPDVLYEPKWDGFQAIGFGDIEKRASRISPTAPGPPFQRRIMPCGIRTIWEPQLGRSPAAETLAIH